MSTTTKIGSILLVVLATYVIISIPNEVQLVVTPTTSTFSVFENNNWVVGGIETSKLYNGTRLVAYTSREVINQIDGSKIKIIRNVELGNRVLNDIYLFDGNVNDKTRFPIAHQIEVVNGKGLIYQYEVSKLSYDGVTKSIIGLNEYSFGRNMKVKWDGNPYYAKITKGYSGTKLTLKYRVASDYQVFNIRLFDPSPDMNCTYGSGVSSIRYDAVISRTNPPTSSNLYYLNATNQTNSTPLFNCQNNGTASGQFRMLINQTFFNTTDNCGTNYQFNNSINLSTTYINMSGAVNNGSTLQIWCQRVYNASSFERGTFKYNISIV